MSNDTSPTNSESEEITATEQRRIVRDRYSDVATDETGCCGDATETKCCDDGTKTNDEVAELSRSMGYSDDEIEAVESGANLGLGCGNPTAIANLETGETVLDLGSGAGFDCFLAAEQVGKAGRVIGVDMTPEMIETARENATKNDATNAEFRLGEIEHLPVADSAVDVIISNCVVNLSPDKPQVFYDAYRVLRPGGRLAISDIVLTASLPPDVRRDPDSISACIAGASPISELEAMLADAGFTDVSITPKSDSEEFIREWDAERDMSEYIVSARIEARKP